MSEWRELDIEQQIESSWARHSEHKVNFPSSPKEENYEM